MDQPQGQHKRRERYRGTHPRRFAEKYKELQPERYQSEVRKILQSGRTPAGMHRPICVNEILEILDPQPGETGLDATLGYGGHTLQLLKRMNGQGRILALDADPIELPKTERRLRRLGYNESMVQIRRMNFAGLGQLLVEVPQGFDFILADLGVSSMQLDNPDRGFSYKQDGPLDLRLNPRHGQAASEFLASCSQTALEALLRENADEPLAKEIAAALTSASCRILTTRQLADRVTTVLNGLKRKPPTLDVHRTITRVFQALRIAVNDEFGALDQFLSWLPDCLRTRGRVAILAFHSGEDRRVKKAFKQGFLNGVYARIAADPIRPSMQEQSANPRSGSAKLRWAVKA